jgi:ribonuclease-3
MSLRQIFSQLSKLLRPKKAAEFAVLEQKIGYAFRNPALLETALTHPSVKCSPAMRHLPNYQRLEFLGDAVLGLVLAESLFNNATDDEGFLTNARTRIVCGTNLAAAGRALGLGALMRLPRGRGSERLRDSSTAHEDMLEALFGAVFLDGGLPAARRIAARIFDGDPEDWSSPEDVEKSRSAKCKLQEHVQRDGRPNEGRRIEYRTTGTIGNCDKKKFIIEVWVDGVKLGEGTGKTKRDASEEAATLALGKLCPE